MLTLYWHHGGNLACQLTSCWHYVDTTKATQLVNCVDIKSTPRRQSSLSTDIMLTLCVDIMLTPRRQPSFKTPSWPSHRWGNKATRFAHTLLKYSHWSVKHWGDNLTSSLEIFTLKLNWGDNLTSCWHSVVVSLRWIRRDNLVDSAIWFITNKLFNPMLIKFYRTNRLFRTCSFKSRWSMSFQP